MTNLERYNKYYYGKQFKVYGSVITYTFGEYVGGCVFVSYYVGTDVDRQLHELDNVIRNIDKGWWKLYLNDERKLKLKKLMAR